MTPEKFWQRITTSRRTREREAAAQRENAQRESALRDELARRTHALEAQIAQAHAENCRLRAENRALLNSVLGIAGIPPVIVADPPSAFIDGATADAPHSSGTPVSPFVGAQHAMPGADAYLDAAQSSALSSRQRRDVCVDEGSAVRVDGEKQKQIPRTTPRAPENRGNSNNARDSARDDNAVDGCAAPNGGTSPSRNLPPNGSASPSTIVGRSSATPLPNQTLDASISHETNTEALQRQSSHPSTSNTVPPQKQLRRGRSAHRDRAVSDPHAIAPIRRRSWHQIYRMLEFESSRRKNQES